jgi:hypothetical protein
MGKAGGRPQAAAPARKVRKSVKPCFARIQRCRRPCHLIPGLTFGRTHRHMRWLCGFLPLHLDKLADTFNLHSTEGKRR